MTNKFYNGSTTPFNPDEWSGGNLEPITGTGITFVRNGYWTPDTQSNPATALTVITPADGDVFYIKCDQYTNETNKITVTASGGQTIDGDATFEITTALAWSQHRYDLANTNWELIGGYSG